MEKLATRITELAQSPVWKKPKGIRFALGSYGGQIEDLDLAHPSTATNEPRNQINFYTSKHTDDKELQELTGHKVEIEHEPGTGGSLFIIKQGEVKSQDWRKLLRLLKEGNTE